jgi:site-specific DNA-methyltransferase (adenine-specific)
MDLRNCDGRELLRSLDDASVDLILTDPPYIISHETGMDKFRNDLDSGKDLTKTEQEWDAWHASNPDVHHPNMKENYLKYGTVYGKKYGIKTRYGTWDEGGEFTMDDVEEFVELYYKKLRDGGTCIVWFDLWKIGELKRVMEAHKFKQIRMIEWIKTNPQPLNSSTNYLTNAREIALVGVKKSKPTFHSEYDKGIYEFPIQGGRDRFHPTQKNIAMFERLIEKHSNPDDLVCDTFVGGGTTVFAAKATGRRFTGSEINEEYFSKVCEKLKFQT